MTNLALSASAHTAVAILPAGTARGCVDATVFRDRLAKHTRSPAGADGCKALGSPFASAGNVTAHGQTAGGWIAAGSPGSSCPATAGRGASCRNS
jgi:hypothetical protein